MPMFHQGFHHQALCLVHRSTTCSMQPHACIEDERRKPSDIALGTEGDALLGHVTIGMHADNQ